MADGAERAAVAFLAPHRRLALLWAAVRDARVHHRRRLGIDDRLVVPVAADVSEASTVALDPKLRTPKARLVGWPARGLVHLDVFFRGALLAHRLPR